MSQSGTLQRSFERLSGTGEVVVTMKLPLCSLALSSITMAATADGQAAEPATTPVGNGFEYRGYPGVDTSAGTARVGTKGFPNRFHNQPSSVRLAATQFINP